MANPTDKIIKSLESRVKDLELEVKNNRIRNKRLKGEVDTAISGILKAIGKQQSETYLEFRKELKANIDAERKKMEAELKKRDALFEKRTKDFMLTPDELRKMLK